MDLDTNRECLTDRLRLALIVGCWLLVVVVVSAIVGRLDKPSTSDEAAQRPEGTATGGASIAPSSCASIPCASSVSGTVESLPQPTSITSSRTVVMAGCSGTPRTTRHCATRVTQSRPPRATAASDTRGGGGEEFRGHPAETVLPTLFLRAGISVGGVSHG